MKNLTKNECIPLITNAAKLFDSQFVNRNFLVIYKTQPTGYSYIETKTYPANFAHLTGVKLKYDATTFFY